MRIPHEQHFLQRFLGKVRTRLLASFRRGPRIGVKKDYLRRLR